MEFVVIIVLLIIGKFVYDWNKQNKKIAAAGGMRKKYAQFISNYESHSDFKVIEEKPDHIVFATLNSEVQVHYKIEENFNEVTVHLKSISSEYSFMEVEFQKKYRVGTGQVVMFQSLDKEFRDKTKAKYFDIKSKDESVKDKLYKGAGVKLATEKVEQVEKNVNDIINILAFARTYFLLPMKEIDSTTAGYVLNDAGYVTSLSLYNKNLRDIPKELVKFRYIETLNLDGNQISNLDTLSEIAPRLKSLEFDGENISNFKFLSDFHHLEALSINNAPVIDYNYLSRFTNLRSLDLRLKCHKTSFNSTPADLSTLSGLKQLKKLSITNNAFSDISFLAHLKQLTHLTLAGNNFKLIEYSEEVDYNNISQLTHLESLMIYSNWVSDLNFLSSLTKLKGLNLANNYISDISCLANLTELESLSLAENYISNIDKLSSLIKIKTLILYDNQVTNLRPLSGMINIEYLDLSENRVFDIEPLVPHIRNGLQVDLHKNFFHHYEADEDESKKEVCPYSVIKKGNKAILDWYDSR